MNEPQTVGDLGEFALIRRIRELLEQASPPPGVMVDIGDDAAVLRPEPGWDWVVTCDAQVAGRHFSPSWMGPCTIGRRAMTVNLSDLAAMGAEPRHALVSLGLPRDLLVQDVDGLYTGFQDALCETGARIVGGNITSSGPEWFCDITLIGRVEQDHALRRSHARPGDRILVTGSPGRSAAGLAVLQRLAKETAARARAGAGPPDSRPATRPAGESGSEPPTGPFNHAALAEWKARVAGFVQRETWARPLVLAYLCPTARLRAGRGLSRLLPETPPACVDLSDGLTGDLLRVCEASRVRARIDGDRLPSDPELEQAARHLGRSRAEWSLIPSDDYELLLTVPAREAGRIAEAMHLHFGLVVTDVGEILENVSSPGEAEVIVSGLPEGARPPQGWDHFRTGSPESS